MKLNLLVSYNVLAIALFHSLLFPIHIFCLLIFLCRLRNHFRSAFGKSSRTERSNRFFSPRFAGAGRFFAFLYCGGDGEERTERDCVQKS